jgi:hypothetical protein
MALRRVLPGLGLALALALAPFGAAAQEGDRARARAEFQRGVDAYARGDFGTALDAFQEAYRIAPHPNVRVNIANCYERMNRPLEALFHFELFLAEAGRPPPAQRREVEAAIRRLRGQVGEIELRVTPDGALVTIDGTEQRRAPVTTPVRVVAGTHTVEVQMDGFQSERQVVEVQGGSTARVEVRLRRQEGVAASTGASSGVDAAGTSVSSARGGASAIAVSSSGETGGAAAPNRETAELAGGPPASETAIRSTTGRPPPPDEEPRRDDGAGFRLTVPTVIGGALTIAAGIAAGVTGGLALAANSEFETNAQRYEESGYTDEQARVDGESAANRARTLAVVSDVFLVTAIVGAGATVFLLITTQEGGMLDEGGGGRGATVSVVPLLGPDRLGIGAAGRF